MKRIYFSAIVLVLAFGFSVMPATAQNSGLNDNPGTIRRFGLFIGANNGGLSREQLMWAVSDAQRMSQVMTEIGGMQVADQRILTDPKTSDVQAALTRMKSLVDQAHGESRRVEFMLYYSGHSDETGLLLGDERLEYAKLRAAITDVKADVSIAVLDSCASGAFTRQKGGTRVQPFLMDSSNDVKGYAYLTSASADEAAQESDRLGASFFTHFIISGLRGAADASADGRVTLNEAYQYAFNETLARTESTVSGPQHPSIDIQLKGYGDLVLSDLSQPSASIALAADIDGRVSVRDAKGVLAMELSKQSGKSMTLALQPGTYSVRVETQTGVFGTAARINKNQQVRISNVDLQKAQLASNRTRGTDPSGGPAETGAADANGNSGTDENSATADSSSSNSNSNATTNSGSNPKPGSNSEEYKKRARDLVRGGIDTASTTGDTDGGQTAGGSGNQSSSQSGNQSDFGTDDAQWISIGVDVHVDLDALGKTIDNKIQEALGKIPEGVAPWIYEEKKQPAQNTTEDEPDRELVPFHFSFVPGMDNAPKGRKTESFVSLSPLINFVDLNTGVMLAPLINIAGTAEHGAQFSFIINTAPELTGAQVSTIGNIAANVVGAQLGAIFAISSQTMQGAQISTAFNIASDTMWGAQIAPGFNVADGDARGVQIGGVFNYASDMKGVQVASILNVADSVQGVQIGLVNISRTMEGLPIGLVNIVKDGIHDIGYWNTVEDRHWVGFYNGSKNFYGKAFVGMYENINLDDIAGLTLGAAIGSRAQLGPVYFDFEASVKRPSRGNTTDERAQSIIGQGIDEGAVGIGIVPAARVDVGFAAGIFRTYIGVEMDSFFPGTIGPQEYYAEWTGKNKLYSTIRGPGGETALVFQFVAGASFSF